MKFMIRYLFKFNITADRKSLKGSKNKRSIPEVHRLGEIFLKILDSGDLKILKNFSRK